MYVSQSLQTNMITFASNSAIIFEIKNNHFSLLAICTEKYIYIIQVCKQKFIKQNKNNK